jgi:hypothetical protein
LGQQSPSQALRLGGAYSLEVLTKYYGNLRLGAMAKPRVDDVLWERIAVAKIRIDVENASFAE